MQEIVFLAGQARYCVAADVALCDAQRTLQLHLVLQCAYWAVLRALPSVSQVSALVAGSAVELGGSVAPLAGAVAEEALRWCGGGVSVHVERARAVAVPEPEEGRGAALDAGALFGAEADVAVR